MPRHGASSSSETPEQRWIRENTEKLEERDIISTPVLDFGLLEELGISDEFHRLTERIGIKKRFWEISEHYPAYEELTKEFLASLMIVEIPNKGPGISFTIQGQTFTRTYTRLARWFHLEPHQTDYLGYIPEEQVNQAAPLTQAALRASFWPRITGQALAPVANPDPRVGMIVHPVLRFICRALGNSTFARGESSLRPRHEELELLATMLRPDAQLQRPNLVL